MGAKGRGTRRNRIHQFPKRITLFLISSLLLVWIVAFTASFSQRQATISQAEDEIFRLTQMLAEQTGNLILDIRAYFSLLDMWLTENPQADPRNDPRFLRMVTSLRQKTRVTIEVRLVAEDGGLYYVPSARTEAAATQVEDREYFRVQNNPRTRGFHIGSPIISRLSGNWAIPISYPVSSRNVGLSIMLILIELPVLNEHFELVRPKPDGAITLVRADGVILDRVPFDESVMGVSLAGRPHYEARREGIQTATSYIDGKEKIFATSKIRDLPLEVSLAVSKAEVLKPWSSRMFQWAGILAIISLILVIFGLSLRRSWVFVVASEQRARALNEELRNAKETSLLITEHSNDILTVIALPDFIFEFVSPSIERHRGWTPAEFMSLPPDMVLTPVGRALIHDKMKNMLVSFESGNSEARFGTMEVDLPHKSGHLIPYELMITLVADDEGRPFKILTLARDLSERRANDELIRHMAFYDRLTNLPNRRLLEDRLFQLLAMADRDQLHLAMLFIDLDKFKPVNDTLGHGAGDWLLQQVALRMQSCLRASDTVARIGGDEFVVLLPEIESIHMVRGVAEKIRQQLDMPYERSGEAPITISASIGIVLYPDHAHDLRELLLLSDEAMYQAKKSGRNQVMIYDASQGSRPRKDSGQLVHLQWNEAYRTGSAPLDQSRREMFQKANALLDLSMASHAGDPAIESALDILLHHIKTYFAAEEEILLAATYPRLTEHQVLHRKLLNQMDQMKRDYLAGVLYLGAFIEFFASRLIAEHLLKADSDYQYLFASGGQAEAI